MSLSTLLWVVGGFGVASAAAFLFVRALCVIAEQADRAAELRAAAEAELRPVLESLDGVSSTAGMPFFPSRVARTDLAADLYELTVEDGAAGSRRDRAA